MKRFIWFVAVTAAASLALAVIPAAQRANAPAQAAWLLIGPASFALAALYVAWRKPARSIRWALLGITGIGTVLAALVIAVVDLDSAGIFAWLMLGPTPFLVGGIFILVRQPEHRVGWLLTCAAAFTMCYAALLEQLVWRTFEDSGPQDWMSWALAIESVVMATGLVCLILLIGLFPTGRARDDLEQRVTWVLWSAPLLMIPALLANEHIVTDGVAYAGLDPIPSPFYVEALGGLGSITASLRYGIGALVIIGPILLFRRYRRVAAGERQQIRWVLYSAAVTIAISVLPFVAVLLVDPDAMGHSPVLALTALGLLLIPASVVVAIEQPAWIDTDAVIRKSFAYGALSVGIFVVYGLVAAGLGLAAGARLPLEVAIVVTAVLAFLFQPARVRLQRVADRWVFGEQPTPLQAVARFEQTMRESDAAEDLSETLADTVRRAARLRWASVVLPPDPPADSGHVTGTAVLTVPIRTDEADLGEIRCGPKVAGQLTDDDTVLVNALAGQAALVVSNARLAARIVQAQEAERRRIERNIHDGAQQELVALVAKLGLARAQARTGELEEAALIELQQDAGMILRDLRDLAQGIHPSVLTDGGLVEAVEDRCGRLPIDVTFDTTPGLRHQRFDDDVEGAAYFFFAEGLANVLKHADASSAAVGVRRLNSHLELSISDDGVGFEPDAIRHNGLAGLSDRFAALSGTVSVEAEPGSGTVLRARLPVEEAP